MSVVDSSSTSAVRTPSSPGIQRHRTQSSPGSCNASEKTTRRGEGSEDVRPPWKDGVEWRVRAYRLGVSAAYRPLSDEDIDWAHNIDDMEKLSAWRLRDSRLPTNVEVFDFNAPF
ncbi:unnamed protein product [Cyclocybe aegerita]|uniref:Uncharacterized protein n=1 Tax=Cyclocybe aegerita TaxID=1973307 RepID=A0A8S0W3L6_CYCAE|nr:unnamed protein product [Cyclocybe aegerita]